MHDEDSLQIHSVVLRRMPVVMTIGPVQHEGYRFEKVRKEENRQGEGVQAGTCVGTFVHRRRWVPAVIGVDTVPPVNTSVASDSMARAASREAVR
jgi:hypothetical protein